VTDRRFSHAKVGSTPDIVRAIFVNEMIPIDPAKIFVWFQPAMSCKS